jgi:hypothetical protein
MQQAQVDHIACGDDFGGLSDYERQEFEWEAIDVVIPVETARLLKQWQLSNVSLELHRCLDPSDNYPSPARMGDTLFQYQDLPEKPRRPVTLTFYVPTHVQRRENFDCATFDARGYSPVILRSERLRLPPTGPENVRSRSIRD